MKIKVFALSDKAVIELKKVSKDKKKGVKIAFFSDAEVPYLLLEFGFLLKKIYETKKDLFNDVYLKTIKEDLTKRGLSSEEYEVKIE